MQQLQHFYWKSLEKVVPQVEFFDLVAMRKRQYTMMFLEPEAMTSDLESCRQCLVNACANKFATR